jgi:hypothetical protein
VTELLREGADAIDLAEPLACFARHGWARLGRVASEEALAGLRARTDDLMLGNVVHEGLFFQKDSGTGRYEDLSFGRGWEGPSLEYRKIEKLEKDDRFRAWMENPLFERVARALIPGPIAVYRALLFAKSAAGGTALPWHQDGGSFWGLDREPFLQIWTALDDAPEAAGCVECVDASHAGGLATPLGGTIPADVVRAARAEERVFRLPAEAGEAILIHNHLWHRSGTNATGRPRRAFTVCFMSADTRCLRKRKTPRTFTRIFG